MPKTLVIPSLDVKAFYLCRKALIRMNIEHLRKEYQAYLDTRNIQIQPENLYKPVNYIMTLGGKHIRATFLLLAESLYQDQPSQAAYSNAYAIELFHNFSLVHDDIMDDANTRRGKPSVHATFGINSGILSGDVMLILVYEELLKITDISKRNKVLAIFTQTAKEVCEGQQYDIDFETRDDVTVDDYLLMIKLKTAVLLACSLQIGAILGGATDEDAKQLYDFGINIGISFQIQDDLLDTYGQKASVGKMIGGDIQQKKKTILYLTALQNMDKDKEAFKTLYNSDLSIDQKLTEVRLMMDQYQVKEAISKLKDDYLQRALACLGNVTVKNRASVDALEKMARYIIAREK